MISLQSLIYACIAGVFSTFAHGALQEVIKASDLLGGHFGTPGFNATFDYVIVGGGTAGLTVAYRLAEAGNSSVAVIEAGSFYEVTNSNRSEIPGLGAFFIGTDPTFHNPGLDWQQTTEPMAGIGNRSIFYNQGKVFGGGSARNFMVYERPTRGSMQRWADEVGDQSYTFESLLPFYLNSTTFEAPNCDTRPENASVQWNTTSYGTGPISVSYFSWVNTFSSWAAAALEEMGLQEVADLVSGMVLGYQYCPVTVDKQVRSSSERGYMRRSFELGSDLVFYEGTMAKNIQLVNGTACGVSVETQGIPFTINANKEVIISAGAFRSPQLLQVSGIGARAELEAAGIQTVQNLWGVGKNMQDQPIFGRANSLDGIETHSQLSISPAYNAEQVTLYNTQREGMLTNGGVDFVGYEKLPASYRQNFSNWTSESLAQLPEDWPEIGWNIADAWQGDFKDLVFGPPHDGLTYASAVIALLATFSRGNVTITSGDTADYPKVNPNYLADPRDREIAVQAFKRQAAFWTTNALQPIVGNTTFPANVTSASSDEEILTSIGERISPIWHACCTNKMGMVNDSSAVIDSRARVIGIQSLRVVDASSFPFLPPVHPQGTVYALAEKIAHDILHGST